MNDIATTEN